MSLARRVKGLATYYRRGGINEVVLRLCAYGYVPNALFSLNAVHVLALGPLNARALNRPLHAYEFARAHAGALDELMACQGPAPQTSREFFADLFAAGHDCFVARCAGEVAGYFWAFRGAYRLRFDADRRHALTVALPERDVFFGNGFIGRAHRLRGLFPQLVKYVSAQYPGARCYSSVHHTNLGSLQAHRRMGFTSLVTVGCMSLGPLNVFYRADGRLHPRGLLGVGDTIVDIVDYLHPADGATAGTVTASRP